MISKRQIGLALVLKDVSENGKIKDSLGYLIEHRINVYAEDVNNAFQIGLKIFNKKEVIAE